MTTTHAVHTQHRGTLAVEIVVDVDGKAHTVMALPAEQIRLPRVVDLEKSDDRYTGDHNTDRVEFHRSCGVQGVTACGLAIGADQRFVDTRAYKLDQSLCRSGCFSPFEIGLGMAAFGARTGRHVKLVKPNSEK